MLRASNIPSRKRCCVRTHCSTCFTSYPRVLRTTRHGLLASSLLGKRRKVPRSGRISHVQQHRLLASLSGNGEIKGHQNRIKLTALLVFHRSMHHCEYLLATSSPRAMRQRDHSSEWSEAREHSDSKNGGPSKESSRRRLRKSLHLLKKKNHCLSKSSWFNCSGRKSSCFLFSGMLIKR